MSEKSIWCKLGFHRYTPWGPVVATDGWSKGFAKDCMREGCDHFALNMTHRPPAKTFYIRPGINTINCKPPNYPGPHMKDIPAADKAWEKIWDKIENNVSLVDKVQAAFTKARNGKGLFGLDHGKR